MILQGISIYPSIQKPNKRGSYHTLIDYGVLLCTETYKTLYPPSPPLVVLVSELVDRSIDLVRVSSPKYGVLRTKQSAYIFISTMTLSPSVSTMVQDPWLQGTSVCQSVCHPSIHPFLPSSSNTHTSRIKTVVRTEYELQSTTHNTTPSPNETGEIYIFVIIANNMASSLVLILSLYAWTPYKYIPNPAQVETILLLLFKGE